MARSHEGEIIRAGRGAEKLGSWINNNLDSIQQALPKGLDAARLSRVLMNECQRVPKLLECSPVSVLGGFLQASQVGLEIGSHLRQAWLIPFRVKGRMTATLIFGYPGLVTLAYRSGLVVDVTAEAVREGDSFHYSLGTSPSVEHTKGTAAGMADAKVTHAYAVAWARDSHRPKVKVLTWDEIEKVKKSSRGAAYPDSPWNVYTDQMAAKTALRRICKELPLTADTRALHSAVTVDQQADANLSQSFDLGDELGGIIARDIEGGELSPEEEAQMDAELGS